MDKKILLIADDDEMNRRIIKRFLKDSYEVIEASNGREALDTLKEKHVDALLLDIIMPEVDGLEVLKQMGENADLTHIGVLVATSTKEKTERMALSLGADDIVSKPYDPIVIEKRLENILAVKEINVQKSLLQMNDADALVDFKLENLSVKASEISDKICKYADIIKENLDNKELVMQIIVNLKKESESFVGIFGERN